MNKHVRTFVIATSLIAAILIIGATTQIMNITQAKAMPRCQVTHDCSYPHNSDECRGAEGAVHKCIYGIN